MRLTTCYLVDFQLLLGLFDHFLREAQVQLVRGEGRQALAELGQHVVPQLHVALRRVFGWQQAKVTRVSRSDCGAVTLISQCRSVHDDGQCMDSLSSRLTTTSHTV